MNHSYRVALGILLFSGQWCHALPLRGKSFFSPRSQSVNAARSIVGLTTTLYAPEECNNWSLWSFTLAYQQAFNTHRIAQYFFGTNRLRFTGSQVAQRNDQDILADHFGLSSTFASTIDLEPRMRSVQYDARLHIGLDSITSGLYVTLHSPLVWAQTRIDLREAIDNNGALTPYPSQYFSNNAVSAPLTSAIDAFARNQLYADVQEPLKFGRIDGTHSHFSLADVHATLGWNFIRREHGHVGINGHIVIPTGNRSHAESLFEPIVGNGHHWEFGAGASGHVRLWEKDGEQEFILHADATITHLCASRQRRSFDLLRNGFASRYLLVKEFDSNGAYARKLVPAINKTTLRCNVSQALQLEFAVLFGYHYCDLNVDFGYNGWLRSRETITLKEGIPTNKYALKGIQNVTLPAGMASSATESKATILGTAFANQLLVADPAPPVFLQTLDINLKSAAASRAFTHKLFGHASYSWHRESGTELFIGLGAEVEFDGIKPRDSEPNKPTASQWGLWLKHGFVY